MHKENHKLHQHAFSLGRYRLMDESRGFQQAQCYPLSDDPGLTIREKSLQKIIC